MARQFTCPRCDRNHAGTSHSKGSLSVVCLVCVPLKPFVLSSNAPGNGKLKTRKRASREKVSK